VFSDQIHPGSLVAELQDKVKRVRITAKRRVDAGGLFQKLLKLTDHLRPEFSRMGEIDRGQRTEPGLFNRSYPDPDGSFSNI